MPLLTENQQTTNVWQSPAYSHPA